MADALAIGPWNFGTIETAECRVSGMTSDTA